MIVNLSKNYAQVKRVLDSETQILVIDFTGIGGALNTKDLDLINFYDLQDSEVLEKVAIQEYLNFIGGLSNINFGLKPIRSYQIFNSPVYWYTNISLKHPHYHWGLSYFLLNAFIENYSNTYQLAERKIKFVLDERNYHLKDLIINNLKNLKLIEFDVIIPKINTNFFQFKLIRRVFSRLRLIIFDSKPRTSIKENVNNIFFGSSESGQMEFNEIFNLGLSFNNTQYISYNQKSIYRCFTNKKTAIKYLFNAYIKIWKLSKQIESIKESEIIVHRHKLLVDLLKQEFKRELLNINSFLMLKAISSLLMRINVESNVFYNNEFYKQGRLITEGIRLSENSNLKTYGVQHGLIYQSHTVYRFHPEEFEDLNSIPIPQNFMLWGEAFTHYLKKEIGTQLSLIVAGNYKLNVAKNRDVQFVYSNKLKILWCPTLIHYFQLEYKLVKEGLLKLKKVHELEITIRLHPVNHITKVQISNIIDAELNSIIDYNNTMNLYDQIILNDLVLSSYHSTIFLDGIALGRPVIRLVSQSVSPFFDHANSLLFNVKNQESFQLALDQIIRNNDKTDSYEEELDQILYPNSDIWKEVLSDESIQI